MPGHADSLGALNDRPRSGIVAICLRSALYTADVVCGGLGVVGDEAGGGACPTAVFQESCIPRGREVANYGAAGVVGLSAKGSKSGCEEKGGTHIDGSWFLADDEVGHPRKVKRYRLRLSNVFL